VTPVHDAADCSVWCGIAEASDVGMMIHKQAVLVRSAVRIIYEDFELDSYSALGENMSQNYRQTRSEPLAIVSVTRAS